LAGAQACTSSSPARHPAIEVDEPTALFDQPVHVTVTGLTKGEKVTVKAQATSGIHQVWQSYADFTADDAGVVDVARSVPTSGTYAGADGMGLFWSMRIPPTEDDDTYFIPATPQEQPKLPVQLTVTAGGKQLASTTVERSWLTPGETARTLTLAADKVEGVLFEPAPTATRRPGVLVFGGAEGGMQQVFTAALLAAHGYPAVTVAYFDAPGLPAQLENIPLEYFETAGQILARSPDVDPAHLLVMGYSRGSEAALLLADNFPDLFHGAVVYSPSALVNPAQNDSSGYAWLLGGKPVPQQPISIDHIAGPVLAIAGVSDSLWSSAPWAMQISDELDAAKNPYPHEALQYDNAGHGVGTFPYQPIGGTALMKLGGSQAGDVASQSASWAKVLSLLGSL
jgi:dienelactone hydrolase